MNADVTIERLGDSTLLLRLGDIIDVSLTRRVHACAEALRAQAPCWLEDITPAYASLALHIDCKHIDCTHIESIDPLGSAMAWLRSWIDAKDGTATVLGATERDARADGLQLIEIPILYGGTAGPDLADVASRSGISTDEVIARHAAVDYTVAMLGFAPGFPYLLGLDPSLATPRHATPRQRVEAGSVGIGGAQTGIYPAAGPGGWQLIGRTPLRLFDAYRSPPTLLRAGDRVRFVAIDADAFARCSRHSQ